MRGVGCLLLYLIRTSFSISTLHRFGPKSLCRPTEVSGTSIRLHTVQVSRGQGRFYVHWRTYSVQPLRVTVGRVSPSTLPESVVLPFDPTPVTSWSRYQMGPVSRSERTGAREDTSPPTSVGEVFLWDSELTLGLTLHSVHDLLQPST